MGSCPRLPPASGLRSPTATCSKPSPEAYPSSADYGRSWKSAGRTLMSGIRTLGGVRSEIAVGAEGAPVGSDHPAPTSSAGRPSVGWPVTRSCQWSRLLRGDRAGRDLSEEFLQSAGSTSPPPCGSNVMSSPACGKGGPLLRCPLLQRRYPRSPLMRAASRTSWALGRRQLMRGSLRELQQEGTPRSACRW